MSKPRMCKAHFRRLALRSAQVRRESRKYAEVADGTVGMIADLAGDDDIA